MLYRTKQKKIEEAASKVRGAAVDVGKAVAYAEAAEEKRYAAVNAHNAALRAFQAVVTKLERAEAEALGRHQGRRQLLEEQARKTASK